MVAERTIATFRDVPERQIRTFFAIPSFNFGPVPVKVAKIAKF